MPEMHLKQPAVLGKVGFTNSACGLFTENNERIQRFRKFMVHLSKRTR